MRPFCDTCVYWTPYKERKCAILSGGRRMPGPPCAVYNRASDYLLDAMQRDPRYEEWRQELAAWMEAHDGIPSDLPGDPGSAR